LFYPNATQAATWSTLHTPTNITWFTAGAPDGQYTWTVYAYCTHNNTANSSYSDSLSGQTDWYESVTTTTTTYPASPGGATTFHTGTGTLVPNAAATQLSLNISSLVAVSDANGTSSWAVTLSDPNATVVKTWSITTPQTLTYFSGSSTVGGSYSWVVQAVVTSNGIAAAGYSDSLAGTLQWYESLTTVSTNYNVVTGTVGSYTTSSLTVAPAALATELLLNFSALSLPSDTYGTTSYAFTLQAPNGTIVQSWNVVAGSMGTPLSYYASGAAAGAYIWSWYATVTKSGTVGTSTYATSFTAAITHYEASTVATTIYNNNPSGSITQGITSSSTVAPTTVATALAFQITGISAPSNSDGATQYQIILRDPSGVTVTGGSWLVTTPQTLTWYNSAAAAGIYTWVVYAVCTNTQTGTFAYATTLAATLKWYQSTTGLVYTYTNHDGSAGRYTTPANTTAPTGSGSQLQLQLQTVITSPNSYGTPSLTVLLYDPNNTIVGSATTTNITAPVTISYSASGAIAGTYTWAVYAQCTNTSTGPSVFNCSWSGKHLWYAPAAVTSAVYVLAADGFTPRLSTADSNIFYQNLSNTQAQFQIINNSSSNLTFQLGMESTGF
jgi:hypothetical protein